MELIVITSQNLLSYCIPCTSSMYCFVIIFNFIHYFMQCIFVHPFIYLAQNNSQAVKYVLWICLNTTNIQWLVASQLKHCHPFIFISTHMHFNSHPLIWNVIIINSSWINLIWQLPTIRHSNHSTVWNVDAHVVSSNFTWHSDFAFTRNPFYSDEENTDSWFSDIFLLLHLYTYTEFDFWLKK